MNLEIWYDHDTDSPNDRGDWQLHSFNSRHRAFTDPANFIRPGPLGAIVPVNGGISRKLAVGTAFILSYFEHGDCVWGHHGETPSCQWDTTKVAGILVWEQPAKNLGPKSYVDREEDARYYLEEYTDWANGQCLGYTLTDDRGTVKDSCGGFIGAKWLQETIANEWPDLFVDVENKVLKPDIALTGEASGIMEQEHVSRRSRKSV
jgi:hypothetical protein